MTNHEPKHPPADKALVEALLCSPHISNVAITDRAAARLQALAARVKVLEAEVERLRGELRFYAREQSWKSSGVYMSGKAQPTAAEIDRGDRARAALEPKP